MNLNFLFERSVIPLLRDSIGVLMQRQPKKLDRKLPEIYRRVFDKIYLFRRKDELF